MIQLRFLAPPDHWAETLCHEGSASVKVLGVKTVPGRQSIAHFVEITSMSETASVLRKRLSSSKEISSLDLTELTPNHLIGSVTSSGCKVCRALVEADAACFISSASMEDECTMGYKLFLDKNGVPKLLTKLSKGGVDFKIADISPVSQGSGLTDRQHSVLKLAMQDGLYDYPRRITHEELAAKLGVKPSTLTEILRRAEKKIVSKYLDEMGLGQA